MPRILVDSDSADTRMQKRSELIDKVEIIAREVFGVAGILPIESKAVEIIPAFESFGGKNELHIFLHEKPERTREILRRIAKRFEESLKNYEVFFNDQPEKLWRRF